MEDLMNDWDLLDVKPNRGKYTLTNKRVGVNHIAARLDHFLVSTDLLFKDKQFSSTILGMRDLDHRPIRPTIED